jgi:hypothetical protein
MHLGAYGGDFFDGILAIGCNDDFASIGLREYGNRTALRVPICLLNGSQDNIAGTGVEWYGEMVASLRSTGFSSVRTGVYSGGHVVPYSETVAAFRWLEAMAR